MLPSVSVLRRLPYAAGSVRLASVRYASSSASSKEPLVMSDTKNGIMTLRFNDPKKFNAWSMPMMLMIRDKMAEAETDDDVKALILTGTDPYYCAGVNLAGILKPAMPVALRDQMEKMNRDLFDGFIEYPKPIIVAVNGPDIGAAVTSATLCDAVIASEKATFSTPFHSLGIVPEGCSSVVFERLMGADNAQRMLGEEGWQPTAAEAAEAGLITKVVPHESLMDEAQAFAEKWVADGKGRSTIENGTVEELKAVNARESAALANAFLSYGFLDGQYKFLSSRGKTQAAAVFWLLKTTRPLWAIGL